MREAWFVAVQAEYEQNCQDIRSEEELPYSIEPEARPWIQTCSILSLNVGHDYVTLGMPTRKVIANFLQSTLNPSCHSWTLHVIREKYSCSKPSNLAMGTWAQPDQKELPFVVVFLYRKISYCGIASHFDQSSTDSCHHPWISPIAAEKYSHLKPLHSATSQHIAELAWSKKPPFIIRSSWQKKKKYNLKDYDRIFEGACWTKYSKENIRLQDAI